MRGGLAATVFSSNAGQMQDKWGYRVVFWVYNGSQCARSRSVSSAAGAVRNRIQLRMFGLLTKCQVHLQRVCVVNDHRIQTASADS